jgi:hypothetical protein
MWVTLAAEYIKLPINTIDINETTQSIGSKWFTPIADNINLTSSNDKNAKGYQSVSTT